MEIKGSHVLITGASRGIGAAMAKAFAAEGARVSLAARSADAIERLASDLGGKAFPVDLLDPDQVDNLIERVEAEAGPIDILVNNAGLEIHQWVHELDTADVRSVIRLNLEASVLLTTHAISGMIDRGRGHVVFMSSLAATGGFPGMSVYGATKAGISNFVAAIRPELDGTGVGTTVVAPGPIDTAMWDSVEGASSLDPMLKRLNRLQLIPKKSPEKLAKQTIAAVLGDKRHVRTPRRLLVNFWARELPTRMTEMILKGVPVGVNAPK